jgi:very-short-patch-repair endonuclease
VSDAKKQIARGFRRQPTPAEAVAWAVLRTRPLGLKWRRQQVIRGFIVDFYCPSLRVVLEVDGPIHHTASVRAADEKRTAVLTALGLRVLRVGNDDVEPSTLLSFLVENLTPNSSP